MRKRITVTSLLLAAAAFIFIAGSSADAKDPPAIKDVYVIDGITYYNVNSSHFNNPAKLYEEMFSYEYSEFGEGMSLGKLWLLAGAILPNDTRNLSIIKQYLPQSSEKTSKTSLYYYYEYNPPEWHNDNGGYIEVSCEGRSGVAMTRKVRVRFSDFKVVAILPGDSNHYISTTIANSPASSKVEPATDLSLWNDSNESPTMEKSLGSSVTEGFQTSITNSSSYSFKEGITVASEFGMKLFGVETKTTVGVSLEFEQAFSNAWTNTTTKETTKTDDTKASVSLKPYTVALMNVKNTDVTTTTRYNCPIGIVYKAEIYIYQMGDTSHTYTFGTGTNNAMSDLYDRAFVKGEQRFDSESIDWVRVLGDSDIKEAIQKITTHMPISSTGTTTTYHNKATTYTLQELAPIYPLSYISLVNKDNMQKSMKVGGFFYTDAIGLAGFNYKDGEYYKFVPYGKWIVTDENGNEITNGSGAVVLETVATSGQTKCRAVRSGTAYLKYMIDEKSYPKDTVNSQAYITNADLSGTAVIEINVAGDTPDQPSVDDRVVEYRITGDYIGRANAQPEQIEGEEDGKLEVTAEDPTGREIEIGHEWEAKQLASKGINITKDGMISFTRPGRFQVRVISPNGKYYSDWKTINAEYLGDDTDSVRYDENAIIPGTEYADADTVMEITGSYTGGVNNDPELIEGADKLKVRGYDSTGKEVAIIYVWETNNEDGMTLAEDGTVSFTQTGLYHARIRSGEYVSDWVTIKANEYTPARFIFRPTAILRTYDGEAFALLSNDARYEGGLRLMYGLGENAETEPSEYSTEIPEATEAGTYYVWCKIQGDENHDNSDPICVISTIYPSTQPITPETPENPTNNPGSSSGGCDAGIGFAGLLLLGMILKRR